MDKVVPLEGGTWRPQPAADKTLLQESSRCFQAGTGLINGGALLVEVVSIAYKGHERPLDSVVQLVDIEGAKGVDIIALAETWQGLAMHDENEESLDGPAATVLPWLTVITERSRPLNPFQPFVDEFR